MASKKRTTNLAKSLPKKAKVAGASSPLPMSQAEVEAMASGGRKAKVVMERIRAYSKRSQYPAKRRTTKGAPVRISRTEMAAIQRSGNVSQAIRNRMEETMKRAVSAANKSKTSKEQPTKRPPPKLGS